MTEIFLVPRAYTPGDEDRGGSVHEKAIEKPIEVFRREGYLLHSGVRTYRDGDRIPMENVAIGIGTVGKIIQAYLDSFHAGQLGPTTKKEGYQRLFSALCAIKSPPVVSEMDDIIRIVLRYFGQDPEDTSNPWKPIDHAPLDGTYVMVALFNEEGRMYWVCRAAYQRPRGERNSGWFDGTGDRLIPPSHFMPIREQTTST